jgi:hypothetical protein
VIGPDDFRHAVEEGIQHGRLIGRRAFDRFFTRVH